MAKKPKAPRNKTMELSDEDRSSLRKRLVQHENVSPDIIDCTILGDCLEIARSLKRGSVDLLILDPPYNMNKRFAYNKFYRRNVDDYTDWLGDVLDTFLPLMCPTGTIYICGDWYTSISIYAAIASRLKIRSRITWEREKGRGAKTNWKNSSEDIWFCTTATTKGNASCFRRADNERTVFENEPVLASEKRRVKPFPTNALLSLRGENLSTKAC